MSLLDPSAYNFLGLVLMVLAAAAGILLGSAHSVRNFGLALGVAAVCAIWAWYAAANLHPGEERQWLLFYAVVYGCILAFSWLVATLWTALTRQRQF